MPDDVTFGPRVRAIRLRNGLTLDALAARSGVSRATLSKIERCERTPGLEIAVKIADALETSLGQLIDDTRTPRDADVIRGPQPAITDQTTGVRRESLFPTTPGVEIVRFTFPPHTGAGPFASHGAGSQEVFVVLDGAIAIESTGGTLNLSAHDIATISGAQDHSLRNVGRRESVVLVFIVRSEAASPPRDPTDA
jgi:transcriptional regulator with XRE-family HTH domain